MTDSTQYDDPKIGPALTFDSRESALKFMTEVDQAVDLLNFYGYTVLDRYGRPMA